MIGINPYKIEDDEWATQVSAGLFDHNFTA